MVIGGFVDVMSDFLSYMPPQIDHPVTFTLFVLLVVGLIAATYRLYRYYTRPPGVRFDELLESVDSVAILMHANPDPDAMASALAAQELAANRDLETQIYYPGQIRHHENRAFEAVLDVNFNPIERAQEIEEETIVLVDHNEPREFPDKNTISADAVIDHHPGVGTGSEFTDVRPDFGACASIFVEYFRDLDWTLGDPETNGESPDGRVIPPELATGLVYGIQSDTKNLTNGCTSAEFHAVQFLFPAVDPDKLTRIATPDVDTASLDIKARAITNRIVRSPFAVSDVETVTNPDAIPQAADELRRLEGVNAVIVLGDKDGVIRLSGRSSDDRVHMGKILDAVVDDIPMAQAGGHARMGGGTIPIEHMEGLGPRNGLSREELIERLFDAMNGDL